MNKLNIVYFSNSGNTEAMANILADAVKELGKEVSLIEVDQADANELVQEDTFALGCPACGSEELDDTYMADFVESLSDKVSGKNVLLFGSYDWGDGEFMRNWVEQMTSFGANVVGGEGIIAQLEPDDEAKQALIDAAKTLVSL